MATVFLLLNNGFLIRFLVPAYPAANDIDLAITKQLGIIRNAAKLLLGTLFTYLNLRLLLSILMSPRHEPVGTGGRVTTAERVPG